MINTISPTTSFGNGMDAATIQTRREQMFAKMDTNGDGKVDKAEFLAAFQQNSASGKAKLTPDQLFAKLDTNGDGSIDKTEFLATHHKHGARMKALQNPADIFSQIDTNGDGTISKSEYEAFLQKLQSQDQAQANGASTPSPTDTVQLSSQSVVDTLNEQSNQNSSSITSTYQPTGLIPQLAPESTLNVVG